jgi:predicted phage gp36 major capsid-like protein
MTFEAPIVTAETKAAELPASSGEVAAALDEFNRNFDAFKETNDRRLAEIEGRLSGDVVTEEKLAASTRRSMPRRAGSTASPSTGAAPRSRPARRTTPAPASTRPPSTSTSGPARAAA